MRASAVLLSAKLLTLGRMSKLFCPHLIAILYVRLSQENRRDGYLLRVLQNSKITYGLTALERAVGLFFMSNLNKPNNNETRKV